MIFVAKLNIILYCIFSEFPWMMAILKEELAAEQVLNIYQCGGALITPSVVLTGNNFFFSAHNTILNFFF
jgi:hypothetical protein